MNCPYCKKRVGLPTDTGFMEARKFQAHLSKCRKNPRNIVITDGKRAAVGSRGVTLLKALEIRAESGQ
jgi:hypothetical protein